MKKIQWSFIIKQLLKQQLLHMMEYDISDAISPINGISPIPNLKHPERLDYIERLLGSNVRRRYATQTFRLAVDHLSSTTPRDRKQLHELALELAEKDAILQRLGRQTRFVKLIRMYKEKINQHECI